MNRKYCGLGLFALSLLVGMTSCGLSRSTIPTVTAPILGGNGGKPEKSDKPQYVLGEFSLINGTDYLAAPVSIDTAWYQGRESGSVSEYGSYGAKKGGAVAPVNNYVFVNRQDLSSRKLFPNNKFVILDSQDIGEPGTVGEGGEKKTIIKNVKASLYQVVKADTNNDKKLDGSDQKVIGLADANGTNYQELVKGIDRILSIHAQSKDQRVVFYQTGKEYFVASIDVLSKSVKVNKLQSIAE
jgi:hypothetical protein